MCGDNLECRFFKETDESICMCTEEKVNISLNIIEFFPTIKVSFSKIEFLKSIFKILQAMTGTSASV